MRKGILGGTFDPIHNGHLKFADVAIEALGLDELWLIPNAVPWLKREKPLASPENRMAMAVAAARHHPKLFASSIEIDRHGNTYTVDTLEELCAGPMADDEIFLLLGADALDSISRWKNPKRIFELATVVVVPRNGRNPSLTELDKAGINSEGNVLWLEMPPVPISSTIIRTLYAEGEDISEQIPEGVLEFIKHSEIYAALPKINSENRKIMNDRKNLEQLLLEEAIKVGALTFGDFTLSSGKKSPYYFDGRLLTLSSRGALLTAQILLDRIRTAGAQAVGGPTLGADPMVAALVVLSEQDDRRSLNGFIVRKTEKEHGLSKLIEGPISSGTKVTIVDDTCSTGNSLFHAIEAAENAGLEVVLVACILDRQQGGKKEILRRGLNFYSILEADEAGNVTINPR